MCVSMPVHVCVCCRTSQQPIYLLTVVGRSAALNSIMHGCMLNTAICLVDVKSVYAACLVFCGRW